MVCHTKAIALQGDSQSQVSFKYIFIAEFIVLI